MCSFCRLEDLARPKVQMGRRVRSCCCLRVQPATALTREVVPRTCLRWSQLAWIWRERERARHRKKWGAGSGEGGNEGRVEAGRQAGSRKAGKEKERERYTYAETGRVRERDYAAYFVPLSATDLIAQVAKIYRCFLLDERIAQGAPFLAGITSCKLTPCTRPCCERSSPCTRVESAAAG